MELKERMTSIKQKGRMLCNTLHKDQNIEHRPNKMELKEKMTSIKQKGRMLYNTPSQNYTRKDNFRQSQMRFTHYEHGAMELWTGDGLNVHMEQSR